MTLKSRQTGLILVDMRPRQDYINGVFFALSNLFWCTNQKTKKESKPLYGLGLTYWQLLANKSYRLQYKDKIHNLVTDSVFNQLSNILVYREHLKHITHKSDWDK